MNRKLITVLDIFIILFIVALSLVLIVAFSSSDKGAKALVTVDGQILGEYSLRTDLNKEIKTQYGKNTVIISNGECYVTDADCRDGICVSRGKISKVGESIVCLPHKLIVEIK